MKSFLVKIGFFGLSVSILWILLSLIVDAQLKKVEFDYFIINQYYAGDINADVLIAGNSRAKGDISPLILDSVLHINSYNIGAAGSSYPAQIALTKIYMEHNRKPDYIIQSVDNLSLSNEGVGREEAFLARLDDPVVLKLLKQYGELKPLNYYLPFKYMYRPQTIFYGMTEFLGYHRKNVSVKGYEGINKTWDGSFDRLQALMPEGSETPYEPEYFSLFEAYVKDILQDGIKMILVCTPQYIELQKFNKNREESVLFYQRIAKEYGLLFLDYSNDSISYDKDYFYDTQHLNVKGAEWFSRKLADDLKEVIK